MFPATTTFSAYHDMTDRWAMMGTISYEQWNVVRFNHAFNYQSLPSVYPPAGLVSPADPENYSNTLDFSVGTHYTLNDKWMLRGSLKYVGTPTHTTTRNIEFPDAVKTGIQIGARYTLNQKIAFDMMFGHVFWKKTYINHTNLVTQANVNGVVRNGTDVAGIQLVWTV
jgi:long-chain fatty acid transport protein